MRRALRHLARFGSSVLITSGILLLLDAGVTLAWQEPISALTAMREQDALERELADTLRTYRAPPASADPRQLAAAARRYRRSLERGDAVGRIELPTLDRSYVMVQGTDTKTLRKGPGHYPETPLPGEGGTVGVAGHRTTYLAPFRTIDRLDRGERVVLEMPYGRFIYRVERRRIVRPNALWVKRPVGYDRVILTACHPLYSAAKRIVVFARLVKVEPVSKVEGSRDSRKRISPATSARETASTASQ